MRIHIDIPPALLSPLASESTTEPRAPILAKLGGQTVLIELQGVLESEGDVAGQLIGRLGMEGVRLPWPVILLVCLADACPVAAAVTDLGSPAPTLPLLSRCPL